MKSRSPTLEGFRVILREPSLAFAEIAWRWSFGLAAGLLLVFSFFQYLDTLPVGRGDLLLLRTRQPALIAQAIAHIFRGSAFRVAETAIFLAVALALGWIGVAAFARAATVKALLSYFYDSDEPRRSCATRSWRLRSLVGLNVFKVGVTLAALVGVVAAFLLGGLVARTGDAAAGGAFLIVLSTAMLVWLAWSGLNWFLSLAAIFPVRDGQDTLSAIAAAVDLCRAHFGSVLAVGTWFGLAHLTAFVMASSVVALPLAFAGVLPGGMVLGGVLLVTLLYFAVADSLYVGRLAAYLAILELPDVAPLPSAGTLPLDASRGSARGSPPGGRVDPDELILGDLPAV